MSYRHDPDLEFLAQCQNKDLELLVKYLTTDKDGSLRLTEQITSSESYKNNFPNHQAYWKLLASEIQHFGANSLMTLLRGGEGVLYREVINDIADKLGLFVKKEDPIESVELALMCKLMMDAIDKMPEKNLPAVVDALEIQPESMNRSDIKNALRWATKTEGYKPLTLASVVVHSVLNHITNKGVEVRNIPLSGAIDVIVNPVGVLFEGIENLIKIPGPAYRVTIPCSVLIAYLRAKKKNIPTG